MDENACHICLDDLRSDLSTCGCGHVYHLDCIKHALTIRPQCPICRSRALPSDVIPLFFDLGGGGGKEITTKETSPTNNRIFIQETKQQLIKLQKQLTQHEQESQMQKKAITVLKTAKQKIKQMNEFEIAQLKRENFRLLQLSKQKTFVNAVSKFVESNLLQDLKEQLPNNEDCIQALNIASKYRNDKCVQLTKEKNELKKLLEQKDKEFKEALNSHSLVIQRFKARNLELKTKMKKLQKSNDKAFVDMKSHKSSAPVISEKKFKILEDEVMPTNSSINHSKKRTFASLKSDANSVFGERKYTTFNKFNVFKKTASKVQKVGTKSSFTRTGYDGTGQLKTFFFPSK